MTDLRTLNIQALPHLVAIRDEWADIARVAKKHAAKLDIDHRFKSMAEDSVVISAAYLARFNDAVNHYDPDAKRATLDDDPPPPAPEPVAVPTPAYAGTMLTENEIEAKRTNLIGRVAAHARAAITSRFTADEAARRQMLHSQSLAAQTNAAPPLTDGELEELHALDGDHDWASVTRDFADARVDALLAADADALAQFNPEDGWP